MIPEKIKLNAMCPGFDQFLANALPDAETREKFVSSLGRAIFSERFLTQKQTLPRRLS